MAQDNNILLLDLLTLLQKYSNSKNRLSQKEIIEILEQRFHYKNVSRKTVKNNLEKLRRYTDNIDAKRTERSFINKETGEKEEFDVYTDYYYQHPFTESELRLVIDGILFSKHMTKTMKTELIDKLEKMMGNHYKKRKNHILADDGIGLDDSQLFENINHLDKAISTMRKVTFTYNRYVVNAVGKISFEPERSKDGQIRKYVMNPYQMVATNGRYYLICNNDRYNNMSYYRIDRISDVIIEPVERKPIKKIDGYEQGLLMQEHMKQHIYLFSGELIRASIRFQKKLLTEFIDWFGKEHITFSNQTEDEITATIQVNYNALRKWALQYGLYFRVIEPAQLVDDIKEDIKQVRKNYE
ncbi:MAG: WYL domain-containing protein [Lysinibacillus sp.]